MSNDEKMPFDGEADDTAILDLEALGDEQPDPTDLVATAELPELAPERHDGDVVQASAPARMVACPQCATPNPDAAGRRAADAFCSECDYPLFFVSGVVETVEESLDGRDRLPGVAGRDRRTWIGCPECGELNPRDGLHCLRCGAVLRPPVEPEPEPEPEPEFLTPEPVVLPAPPCRRWPMFVWGFAAGWVAMLIAVVVVDRWW